jgi:hypothetical protein
MAACINAHFPASTFGRKKLARSGRIPIVPDGGLLVRLAAGAVAAAFVAEKIAGATETRRTLRKRLEDIVRERRVAERTTEPMLAAS